MRTNRWLSKAAGAGALTLILAMPAVAQTNGDWQQRNGNNGGRDRTQTTAPVQNRDRNSNRGGNWNRGQQPQQQQPQQQQAQQIQTRNNDTNRGGSWGREQQQQQQQTAQIQSRNDNYGRNSGNYDRNNGNSGSYDRNNGNNGSYDRNSNRSAAAASQYRENQRIALSGRISSFSRENNGYRVRLDRGESFFVPEAYYRSHTRNFGIGVSINLGGIFRGGEIYAGDYPVNAGYGVYDNGYIRGVVDRVDYRTGIALVRDDANGRLIEADMRAASRYSRIDAQDLRPGDFVELSGQWVRGNVFAVSQVDNVQSGRY